MQGPSSRAQLSGASILARPPRSGDCQSESRRFLPSAKIVALAGNWRPKRMPKSIPASAPAAAAKRPRNRSDCPSAHWASHASKTTDAPAARAPIGINAEVTCCWRGPNRRHNVPHGNGNLRTAKLLCEELHEPIEPGIDVEAHCFRRVGQTGTTLRGKSQMREMNRDPARPVGLRPTTKSVAANPVAVIRVEARRGCRIAGFSEFPNRSIQTNHL